MFWGFLMLASDMFDLATANASGKLLPDVLLDLGTDGRTGYTMALIGCVSALIRRLVSLLRSSKVSHSWRKRNPIANFYNHYNVIYGRVKEDPSASGSHRLPIQPLWPIR